MSALTAAVSQAIAYGVIETKPGHYECRDCGIDWGRTDAAHDPDCVFGGLIAALVAWSPGGCRGEGLPPGMRFVPGPGGSCAWSSHHWQKMGDRTQCVACNGYMEPIPGPRDETLREALETIDRLIMGEESVARETGRGIERASFRIAGMRAARAALARLTEDAG